MKKLLLTLAIASASFVSVSAQALFQAEQFFTPPMEYRPVPLWFWNNTRVTSTGVSEQLEQMLTRDFYGGCAILPFGTGFAPGYLTDDYFSLYGEAIAKAQEHGAAMSLYDEYGFPSGSMGAINGSGVTTFMNNHPEHTIKRLDKTEYAPRAGQTFSRDVSRNGKLMAVVARETNTGELVNLRPFMDGTTVTWDVPADGRWRVLAFNCVTDGDPNVDYLSAEAVSLFVEDTHQQYYNRFSSAFGPVITSTFFDEPTLYRANGRMWTDRFNEIFEQRYGFSPELWYPALWYDIGAETAIARNALFGLHAQLYAEGFMKTIADWAESHGILSTGHQDQEEVVNTVSVSGDLMLDGKYMSMPGIDKIGGDRPAEHFYKVVSSSANNWDKTYVMSETFGDMGNISVETMYRVATEQYTKGINHLIPHAVWYDDRNVTFRPELSWRNPLYSAALPAFNRFLARLNYILARPAQHVADVAVVYPIQTMQAGHYFDGPKGYYAGGVDIEGVDYNRLSQLLTDELGIDFTYLHPEVIDDRCEAEDGLLVMHNEVNTERFRSIIVSGAKCISISNLRKIHAAWQQGVRVVFTTQLPELSADKNATDEEVKALVDEMLSAESNTAIFVENLSAATLAAAFKGEQMDVEFSGTQKFNYIHKQIDGKQVYYFGNIDQQTATNTITLRTPLADACWLDPRTGDITPAEFTTTAEGSQVALTLIPCQSAFLIERDAIDDINATNPDKTAYTVSLTAVIDKLSAGICFGTADTQNYYMWQVNAENPAAPKLRPHRWFGGGVECMAEIPLEGAAAVKPGEPFDLTIEITGNTMARTLINGQEVDRRFGDFPFGMVGFREDHSDASRDIESAHFDNLLITDQKGRTVLQDDFSGACNFSNASIKDGWLYVVGSMQGATYAWQKNFTAGIPTLAASSFRKGTYSLTGQAVKAENLKAGVYVIDGKKRIVR